MIRSRSGQRSRPLLAVLGAALLLGATGLPATGAAADTGHVVFHRGADALSLRVPPTATSPGYTVSVSTDDLAITTRRAGTTVMSTAAADGLRFKTGDTWQHATGITSARWRHGTLALTADTTAAGTTVTARLTPHADRYRLTWQVAGGTAEQLGLAYDLGASGHWYGHGEAKTPKGGPGTDQPWPLESGQVHDTAFGPASYEMVDPFWYTSSAAGLWVDTGEPMDVGINSGGDGRGTFTVASGGTYDATVFVEANPRAVYRDYTGLMGKPAKSDATYRQYAEPLWNSWAQFYTKVDQPSLLQYARELHASGVGGHTIQLDDKWESNYGNLTFDAAKFPQPKAMSDEIHAMGYDFGLWTTLWINLDSVNYQYAADHGYLLKDKTDPSKPCQVTWWNGTAGIVDLANQEAADWYAGNLRKLMADYGVDGFKFDTRFFDDKCAPDAGHTRADYQRLGAELADGFDQQGAGIRVHWSKAAHESGFVTRQVDKGTGWNSLQASVTQNLAISTIGYPFVETDMIGGSSGQPAPTKELLVRWAESAALMPLMYSSTSPIETNDPVTGEKVVYDPETAELYRAATERHERLAPYLWDQVKATLKTGDPIMRPLFFDFPSEKATYTVDDEWMLGPAVLAAPKLDAGGARDVYLPKGTWYDVARGGAKVRGPVTLKSYAAPLGTTPVFVKARAVGAGKALRALLNSGG